ncbi:MAG: helix-turn-helix domain-containing protein [Planctomycetia bacterium]
MEQAAVAPYPHMSWLGTWKGTGRSEANLEFGMRQVAHCLIYTARGKADVTWVHGGREDRFRVDAGTVRFCPADDADHTLIGRRCGPGHRFYTLLIPRAHLVHLGDAEGLAAIPELRHSVSARDAVLTSCMRTLSSAHRHRDEASLERRESAALSLILRLFSKNGWRGPDWKDDNSVFPRQTLDGLVAYIDDHLQMAPSLREMCMLVGMSPSHFGKKFRQSTGLSLHRFINYRRIRKSLRMLTGEATALKPIGAAVGFSSHSHFTRTFAELTGMTPGKFRKQFKRRGGGGPRSHSRSAPTRREGPQQRPT